MKIRKFNQFILEEFEQVINDTPESYVDMLLMKLKRKIDKMFEYQDESLEDDNMTVKKAKLNSKGKKDHPTFKEFNLRLESSEISTRSQLDDNLNIKFSDDESNYNLLISINTKNALPTDLTKDFTISDIKQCYIKFKKYNNASEIIGQITKNTDPNQIDEEFIVNLKIELDEEFGDEEEFKIETE